MKVPAINPNAEDENETSELFPLSLKPPQRCSRREAGILHPGGLWIVSAALILVIASVIGYFTYKYLDDPYRILKPFPMDTYLSDYHSLAGEKFKADLKVSAELEYKSETGRLMKFTVNDDVHSLVVLIPPKLSNIYFTKGQNYLVSLEVGEGGLVYADSCEKE